MRLRPAAHDVLANALRVASLALAPRVDAMAAVNDPIRLDLPPLALPSAPQISAQAISAYAALYLHAELEQAGVLPIVELMVEMRNSVTWREASTFEKIERFARATTSQHTRAERAELYARLFGLGEAARVDPRHPVRVDFMQRFLRFATAIERTDAERARFARVTLLTQAQLRASAQNLLDLLTGQPEGYLIVTAQRIHTRTLAAFDLLGDPGLRAQLGSQSTWDSLRRLSQGQIAGMDDAARRGAAGQTMLRWLGVVLPSLSDVQREVATPDAATAQAARRWLITLGLPVAASLGHREVAA